MKTSQMNTESLRPYILMFLVFLAPTPSHAFDQFKQITYPIPIDINNKTGMKNAIIKSDIYIVVNFRNNSETFDRINNADLEENFVKTQAGYLLSNNFADYENADYQTTSVISRQILFNTIKKWYVRDKPDTLGTTYRWGGIDYIILKSSVKNTTSVPFIAIRDHSKFETGFGLLLNPVMQNLSSLIGLLGSNSKEYTECPSRKCKYSVRIPSPIPSPDRKNDEIEILFNGQVIKAKEHVNGNIISRDYSEAGPYKSLIDFYIGKFGDTNIKFILDAGNLKLLFYKQFEGREIGYVTIEQIGGQFKVVNEQFLGPFDELITSDSFTSAINRILKQ